MTNDFNQASKIACQLSLEYMTSVKDCMLEITTNVDAVIDIADEYEGDYGNFIWRYTPPGQYSSYVWAHQDIDSIDKAATKFIDIIDKHSMPK